MRDKAFWTHPDNEKLFRGFANNSTTSDAVTLDSLRDIINSLDIKTSNSVPKSQSTGRVVTRDGKVHERKGFRWQWDRFTTLEESDLSWAIPLGLVREETEAVAYMIDMRRLMRYSMMPTFNVSPRMILMGSA